jgi:hypothetical protein
LPDDFRPISRADDSRDERRRAAFHFASRFLRGGWSLTGARGALAISSISLRALQHVVAPTHSLGASVVAARCSVYTSKYVLALTPAVEVVNRVERQSSRA